MTRVKGTMNFTGEDALSWTKLSTWSAGRHDEAILMIENQEMEDNIYMRDGRRIHNLIAKKQLVLHPWMSKETGRWELPDDEDRHKDPNYMKVHVFEWLDINFKADYLDITNKLLIDFKTGSRKSSEHNFMQLYVYSYLLYRLGIEIDKAMILKVGENDQGAILGEDFCLFKMNADKLEVAENYIESNASEIVNFYNSLHEERK